MKKKILSTIIAAVMAVTLVGFAAPTAMVSAAETSVEASDALKITSYTADRYIMDEYNEYPGHAKVGDNIHISFKAEGGQGKITYSYEIVPFYGQYVKTIKQDNLDNGDFVWTPTDSQRYEIELRATDEAGNTTYQMLHYIIGQVKDINVDLTGDYLTHPDNNIQGYAVVGQDIKLAATSNIESSWKRTYTYTIKSTAHGTTKTVTTTDGNYTWTPTGEDLYKVTVTAEDCYGNQGSKTVQYVISHPLTMGSFTANGKTSSVIDTTLGKSIDLDASANGGALAGYTYTYDILPGDDTDAQAIKVSQANGKYTFTPSAKGQYLVKVTAKDEQGTTVSASKEVFVR